MGKKIVIVGGVAGGASAATRLRRLDEEAEIFMFERDGYVSFANCGLPYYIGETIQDRSKLLVQTPEKLLARFNIDVRIHSEVVQVFPDKKTVLVNSKDRGMYEESYDSLILSPGAKPLRPPIPGIDGERIYTLRNIPDTDRVKQKVDEENTKSAIVIGGGFIGVEMAENLIERGLSVTLIEAAPHVLAPFDTEMVMIAEQELAAHGVELVLGDGVEAFQEDAYGVEVSLKSGRTVKADMVLAAIGVAPDTKFLKDSGLELGPRGHIIVNDGLETNIAGIYAVGDAIEIVDYVHGGKGAVPLAGPANKQGRIVADQIAGLSTTYKGTQGTSIIKIFSLTGASTGLNERTLRRLQIPYHAVYSHPSSHATYYPDAETISMKLLFDPDGKVLGAQAFGREGVDKRIDVIATVIRLNGSIYDLTELELSYAPPFSSAKDPVNMIGYMAENFLSGKTDIITINDIDHFDADKAQLVDVRSNTEHKNGHIPGSIHIPVDELRQRLNELDKNKEIWAYCAVGLRGYTASRILSQNGFRVKNLSGGYSTYAIAKGLK